MPKLNDLKIAILTEEGFEQVELTSPREALEQAGVNVHIISPKAGEVKAWNETDWGIRVKVDKKLSDANPDDYDGLLLPGGVLNPDKLRANTEAVEFVKHFLQTGKPIAAICHGPQTLIETGLLNGRKMTSYESIKTDLINAGVEWIDEEVVTDQGLVTSRSPKDLPAFNKKMLEEFAEGVHEVSR
jgi:protease I